MTGSYLLDTNIVIALFANDASVLQRLKIAKVVFVPSIVLGELYYGARNSLQIVENLARIEQFRSVNTILACDEITARYYGDVKAELKQAGRPIPENDIWIVAIARQYSLTIVSRDQHFSHVAKSVNEIW